MQLVYITSNIFHSTFHVLILLQNRNVCVILLLLFFLFCLAVLMPCSHLIHSDICRNRAAVLGPVITGAPEVNYSYLCLVPPIWTTQIEGRVRAVAQPVSRWELSLSLFLALFPPTTAVRLKRQERKYFHSQKYSHREWEEMGIGAGIRI